MRCGRERTRAKGARRLAEGGGRFGVRVGGWLVVGVEVEGRYCETV